jgi:hypothetical protein
VSRKNPGPARVCFMRMISDVPDFALTRGPLATRVCLNRLVHIWTVGHFFDFVISTYVYPADKRTRTHLYGVRPSRTSVDGRLRTESLMELDESNCLDAMAAHYRGISRFLTRVAELSTTDVGDMF